ncbi:hypothetical protein [Methylomonas sp. ZR1]|uniref:hypothetical protein n=1 Tax=Methylomonas sp. ZR1 TaxID=1797072 RepID=UPI00149315F1|nr:hypothetical protein [Methylomonas sp. ZR1]NOV29190.1 hypothetical protein [Methylomonas sp. ZR1]
MKSKVILATICLLAGGCSTNYRYPNWQYVRLEEKTPDNCTYKMQETCARAGLECYDWYKQRATTFGANTVVIGQVSKDERATTNPFTGNYSRNVEGSMLAEYYHCNGEKNILPPKQ